MTMNSSLPVFSSSHTPTNECLSDLEFGAAEEGDAAIIAAGRAFKAIVENSLLSIPKKDSYKAESSGEMRGPRLQNNPTSPGSVIRMQHPVPNLEIGVFLFSRPHFASGR